ncbi:MAG: dihydrolipoamide acetyltransferase family protein [Pseudomonadales bacterium]
MRSFKLQDPGEGIHEAEILEVRVETGDEVSEGDIVLVIETDKAVVEVPAPCNGSIAKIAVAEGDVVEVGKELMRFDDDGEPSSRSMDADDDAPSGKSSADRGNDGARDDGQGEEEPQPATEQRRQKKATGNTHSGDDEASHTELASPAARRLAREAGVELSAIDGSGPDGRVLVEDIRSAGEEDREVAPVSEAPAEEADSAEDDEHVPLRSVRRTVARRMEQAWREIPHVTHTVHADITALSAFRESRKGDFPHLGLTVLVLKALSAALRDHPRFNARLDDEEIVIRRRHHFGVAVDTDRGLLVPVIRDVDRLSMRSLASALERVVDRARGGTLQVEEMRGGTFTVTNVGDSGARHFTPIINPPQAAILGVAQARLEQVALDDGNDADPSWQARRLLPLILAFDHRLNDGMDAARFMASLTRALSGPEDLLAAL